MAPKGTETILGMKRDPAFGPLLMFGLGGVMVEVLKDVTFRLAPITELSTEPMITGIKAYKMLQAFRGLIRSGTSPRNIGAPDRAEADAALDAVRTCLRQLAPTRNR